MTSVHDRKPPSRRARSRRAEGWVHGVLNPLIDLMTSEIARLDRGAIAFHLDRRDLAFIRTVPESLLPSGRHLLRDFLAAHPDARQPLDARDSRVAPLAESARAAFDELTGDARFRALVIPFRRAATDPRLPPPSAEEDDRAVRVVASLVVNRRSDVSASDTDLHACCIGALTSAGTFRHLPAVRALDTATSALRSADADLLRWMEGKSTELCERYDIPAAPIE